MFEAYSIGVKLKLVDGVTVGVAAIGRSIRGLVTDVGGAEASLKRLGIAGAALTGIGVAGLALFSAPLKAAREYELAFTKFKSLNLGAEVNRQADAFARSANLMGISGKQLMTTMSESVGLFGSFADAQKLAPRIAMLNSANSAIFGGKIGELDEGGSRAIMKFIDRRGGTKDEASFMRNLSLAERMVTGSGGFIKFADLAAFSQQGGTAFRGLSDDGILNMALLLQEQGGSRAGTSFMSLYQNLVAGRTPKKTTAMLQDFGLGHLEMETHGAVGGQAIKSLVMRDVKNADVLQANPPLWFQTTFLPALAAKGITTEAGILKATNDLISQRTASSQGSIMSTQLVQILRDANLAKNAMGYDQVIDAWRKDPNSKFADLTARWQDTLRELGETVLPLAIRGVEGLTGVLKTAISFSQQFPALTAGITGASAAMFAMAGVGGSLMLLRAGISGLGLVIGAGAAGGGVGLLGTIGGLLGPIGLAIAGLTALAVVLKLFDTGTKDDGKDHTGMHWELNPSGRGGEWMPDNRVVGVHRGFPGSPEHWVPTPDAPGRGHYESTYVAPSKGPVQVIVHNKFDKHGIATMVTQEQAKSASRPQTGSGRFDPTMNLPPAGG